MAFGSFVAAVYLAGFALWFAVTAQRGAPNAGATLLAVALSAALIVVGLRRGARWARWVGAAAALVFGALALRRVVAGDDGVSTALALLAAPFVALFLALPITGTAGDDHQRAPRRAWPAWVASLALGVALVTGWQTLPPPARAVLPAAARTASVEWRDLREGLGIARESGTPMLVTVEASWCGYCRKMRSVTWPEPEVARRLGQVVAVRVDAEDGEDGSALAARYGVNGYPTQLLLSVEGELIARADGFQSAGQFIGWFDGALRDVATIER